MALYPEFKIATDHDNEAGFVVVESIVTSAPRATPVPLGSTRRVLRSSRPRWDGFSNILWQWGFMTMTDLHALINGYIGSYTLASKAVTIRTIERDPSSGILTYGNYNAYMWLPVPSVPELGIEGDYTQETTTKITDLRLRFSDLTAT